MGKSTLGKKLSTHLGWDFIDIDKIIEKDLQMSCREIYQVRGKEFFRAKEKAVINSLTSMQKTVIATGGSIYLDKGNSKIIQDLGTCVALYRPKKDMQIIWQKFPKHLQEESFQAWYQRRYLSLRSIVDIWVPSYGV